MDNQSLYITYADGPSINDPAAGTYALAGGNDDIAAITDAEWAAAILRFPADLGTGVLIAPGRTSDAGHIQMKTHAETYNRNWFGDAPDTAVVATMTASAAAAPSRSGGLFAPWLQVAGLTPGTYRTVPPSVVAAGIAMRNDALGKSPNLPAAGDLGISKTALNVTRTFTDAEHQALNSGGVNLIRPRFGVIKVLGWRTTVNATSDPKWVSLGNARLTAAIKNLAWLVGERFLFRQIDGNGLLVAEWGAALVGEVLMPFYLAGSLYGNSPENAFRVNLSGNTSTTAQNRQLLADLIVVESEFAEEITINIAKQLITEGVA
jgi:phage tail sheath protein FI